MLPGFHVCRSQLFPLSRPAPGLAAVSFMLLDTCYVLRHTSYVIRDTYDVRRARRHMLRATCYVLRATCCLRLATCCRATGYKLLWFILSSSCKRSGDRRLSASRHALQQNNFYEQVSFSTIAVVRTLHLAFVRRHSGHVEAVNGYFSFLYHYPHLPGRCSLSLLSWYSLHVAFSVKSFKDVWHHQSWTLWTFVAISTSQCDISRCIVA